MLSERWAFGTTARLVSERQSTMLRLMRTPPRPVPTGRELFAGLDDERIAALLYGADADGLRRIDGYLSDEIVVTLDDDGFHALCALTVLGPASAAQVARVLDGEPAATAALLRRLPLVTAEHDRFSLHPLLAAHLVSYARSRVRLVAQRAAGLERPALAAAS